MKGHCCLHRLEQYVMMCHWAVETTTTGKPSLWLSVPPTEKRHGWAAQHLHTLHSRAFFFFLQSKLKFVLICRAYKQTQPRLQPPVTRHHCGAAEHRHHGARYLAVCLDSSVTVSIQPGFTQRLSRINYCECTTKARAGPALPKRCINSSVIGCLTL